MGVLHYRPTESDVSGPLLAAARQLKTVQTQQ